MSGIDNSDLRRWINRPSLADDHEYRKEAAVLVLLECAARDVRVRNMTGHPAEEVAVYRAVTVELRRLAREWTAR